MNTNKKEESLKKDECSHRWTAKGRKHNPTSGETKDDQDIEILEESRSVDMDPDDGKGNKEKKSYGIPVDANEAIKLMKDLIVELNNRAKKENEDFIWIKNLIEKGPGVTFDKNILLKMISQPRCEGIRFYPALKSKGKEFFLSLVIVGVNSEGYDLHYNEGDKKIMDAYITKSLTGEYGHPPGEPLHKAYYCLYNFASEDAKK